MNIFLEKKLCGFSLSEMLISLMIVSVIAVASVPVLTKKHNPKKSLVHGSWTCYRSAGSTLHTATMVNKGVTKTTTSSGSCTFEPPEDAKNFSVKLVGGGGGGAAGTRPTPRIYTSSGSITVDQDGEYALLVIGGGGAGGGMRCGSITMGGGSGGWQIENVILRKNTSYYISIGRGGTSQGADGTASSFSGDGYSFTSTGGIGGNSRKDTVIDCRWTGSNGGVGGSPNGVAGTKGAPGDSRYAGIISNSRVAAYTNNGTYGNGAPPRVYSGRNGVVTLARVSLGSGGAGRPGEVVIKTFPALSKTVVRLGAGGSGGSYNGAKGYDGSASTFGALLKAAGGIGGDPEFVVNRTATAPGQNASVPELTKNSLPVSYKSFGGFSKNNSGPNARATTMIGVNGAGSGGSGGGASMDEYGYGAQGMPGAVIVEW